jgi:hypothetical protein
MSKAKNFVKVRDEALASRPSITLTREDSQNLTPLFRVSRQGSLEIHPHSEFSVAGEARGEVVASMSLSPEEALKLAAWINDTFTDES